MGVSYEELIVPLVCFPVAGIVHILEFNKIHRTRARGFFKRVRKGWIDENRLKGQAACNTTRDYIRAAVFFANTAILLTTFVAGFAGSVYSNCLDDGCSGEEGLFVVKLGCLAAVLLTIFFVFSQCTRFAVHFSFMINVRDMGGVALPKALMAKVFDHAHHYYSLGIRLFFFTIPVYAWIFSEWALLGVLPVYLYVIHGLESIDFMSKELSDLSALEHTQQQRGQGQEGPSPAPVEVAGGQAQVASHVV